ncbi:MAG: hypothetical protein WCK02_15010 [Bacteroidota bacterium]
MNWTQVIKESVFVILTSGIFTWIAQELWKNHFAKRFKKYEYDLAESSKNIDRQLNISIESHKKALELIYFKASRLHDTRIKVIAELYEKLVLLDLAMREMTALLKYITKDVEKDSKIENEKIKHASDIHNEFYVFYLKNKIFLSASTCKLIDKIKEDYFSSYFDYTHGKTYAYQDSDLSFKLAKAASDKVYKEIPIIMENIENEFRAIIGVEK